MRVLVCGGRTYNDKDRVWRTLDEIAGISEEQPLAAHVVVIHGGALGADILADAWAVTSYAGIAQYLPYWKGQGRAAGPIRNQRMIDDGKPDLVVAFPGGKGTADMVRRARAAGIPVREIS